jgi:dimethylhistidine N-methyltransferase
MATEVFTGLAQRQKSLSPKYFYDRTGSELFEHITRLPEYYPTRIETQLLKRHLSEIAPLFGKHSTLFELGSGSSVKSRLLLDAIRPALYVPMDISGEHLSASADLLASDYPWLAIHAVCLDYSRPWRLPRLGDAPFNAFFPGSSIGNFEPPAAQQLLQRIADLLGPGGGLLIGVDLKKDAATLERAYNDATGVTARFNLNILTHLNRRLDTDFDTADFAHRAVYNDEFGRIEMHLVCLREHSVRVNGHSCPFRSGETIHTENSYKYSTDEFFDLAERSGFSPASVWIDANRLFSVYFLTAR